MSFVLDASVALAWFLPDEAGKESDAVLKQLSHDAAVVPALWQLEIANVLAGKRSRGSISPALSDQILGLLAQLPIRVDQGGSSVPELVAAAGKHGLTAYDAEYLLLAQRRGLALATLDGVLAAAAERTDVELVIHS